MDRIRAYYQRICDKKMKNKSEGERKLSASASMKWTLAIRKTTI